MWSAIERSYHPNDHQGWEKGCNTAMVIETGINIDVNICNSTSFILILGCLLCLFVEKRCRQKWVEGKGGGTSPKSSSKNKENPKFPSKNRERETLRPEVQVNPLAMDHDVSQQALGLWCQKGIDTSSDADAHSHCSGWCHGLGLWWWDNGAWGGKIVLKK